MKTIAVALLIIGVAIGGLSTVYFYEGNVAKAKDIYYVSFDLHEGNEWKNILMVQIDEPTVTDDEVRQVFKSYITSNEKKIGKVTISDEGKNIIEEKFFELSIESEGSDAVVYEPQGSTQFININGDTNGTLIYDTTPTFNWSLVADTSMYHLQVATDSAFSSLIVNLSDINEVNYASQYDANATRVSFTLPTPLSSYDVYYCRVKPYEKA